MTDQHTNDIRHYFPKLTADQRRRVRAAYRFLRTDHPGEPADARPDARRIMTRALPILVIGADEEQPTMSPTLSTHEPIDSTYRTITTHPVTGQEVRLITSRITPTLAVAIAVANDDHSLIIGAWSIDTAHPLNPSDPYRARMSWHGQLVSVDGPDALIRSAQALHELILVRFYDWQPFTTGAETDPAAHEWHITDRLTRQTIRTNYRFHRQTLKSTRHEARDAARSLAHHANPGQPVAPTLKPWAAV